MKPISISVSVDRPGEEVFAFLDVLATTSSSPTTCLWTGHSTGAPPVSTAPPECAPTSPVSSGWTSRCSSSVPPITTLEQTLGANGRRRIRGTYTLHELPGGATDIRFELEYLQAPSERLAWPLIRAYMTRENANAMRRLGQILQCAEFASARH
jgi:hypothetical protein